ncbi:MAG: methyl-accepting chemotaxis protein [Proteobacteria bacterium]|nr:methyl-accepting chemotaxis protein [Pseudomonadota bacterium]
MNADDNRDHEFLHLRLEDEAGRTFMGGQSLDARRRLFLLSGLIALAAFAGLYFFVESRVFSVLDDWSRAERLATLVSHMEKGVANARAEEKSFLLKKDIAIADGFGLHLKTVTDAITRLARMPETAAMSKQIATLRDGLGQYDELFAKLVASEKALGLADGTGLSLDLKNATEDLQAKFSTAGYANLAGQVARINQEGKETLLSGYKKGVEEIQKRYQTLIVFLHETKIPSNRKVVLQDLLTQHETTLLAMINSRFNFSEETQRFDDLIAYMTPSIDILAGFSASRRDEAAAALASLKMLSRSMISIGGGAGIIVLMIIGLAVIRSMTTPLRDLAAVAGRLADGDRGVSIPARGNSCAIGVVARALDHWVGDLSELEHLRRELEQTHSRLKDALEAVEDQGRVASSAARAALLSDETEDAPPPVPAAPYPDPMPAANLASGINRGGPISSVSRQLASFSQYVTAAADDVERTEALINGIEDAVRQIDDMSALVMAIRDQTNLLAFRGGPKDDGPSNLVILSGQGREPVEASRFLDADMAKRFDAIRDATERAERTTGTVRNTMIDVTRMAQEIGATASAQALEATTKLLTQSEYLQHMLDDVISKVRPGSVAKTEKPSQDNTGNQGAPPKKA